MATLRPSGTTVLGIIAVACLLLPVNAFAYRAASLSHAAGPALFRSDFATALTTTVTAANSGAARTVTLEVRRGSDDQIVEITIEIADRSGATGSDYTFSVPASDLAVAANTASLDTHDHLGRYGHIGAQWTYAAHLAPFLVPADPCAGTPAQAATRAVASAKAELDLTLPCEGALRASIGGAKLDLYSGQDVHLPEESVSMGRTIYSTTVSAAKALGHSSGLLVSATTSGGESRITMSVDSSDGAASGLIASSHFVTDELSASGLSTGTSGQITLAYAGTLGRAHIVFTAKGGLQTATDTGRCINPNAAKAELDRTVEEQFSDAAVAGPVGLSVCGARQVMFGSGDMGTTVVYAAAGADTSDSLPALGRGNIPSIMQVAPAPGTVLSPSPTVAVTFAGPLPAHAHVVILLEGPAGEAAISDPVVHGSTATVALGPGQTLQPGNYTLNIGATSSSGGEVSYTATYSVKAARSTGGTPAVPKRGLPGVNINGSFPTIVQVSPPPGGRLSRTPTIVLTFAAAVPPNSELKVGLSRLDASGQPTEEGAADLKDPVVKGDTVTIVASSPVAPGKYQFGIMALSLPNSVTYQTTYTVV